MDGHAEPVFLQICLIDEENNTVARADMGIGGKERKKYTVELIPSRTVDRGSPRMLLNSKESVDLDHVSLFPNDTRKGRGNGLRDELVNVLKDLNPGVFRFP